MLVSLVLAACASAIEGDALHVDRPVAVRNMRAINLIYLRLAPDVPNLSKGEKCVALTSDIANDFRSIGPIYEDAETIRLSSKFAKGIGNGLTVWAELPLLFRGGGFLDPIIDWWHQNILHWSDPGRNNSRFGNSVVQYDGKYRFGSAGGLGDITLGATKEISQNLQIYAALKVPSGDASKLLGSGAFDLGLGTSARFRLHSKLSLHAQLAFIAQGKSTRVPNARGVVDQEVVALVWHPNSRDAWILQWQSESSPTRTGISGVDAPHRIVTFAFRRKVCDRSELELYFSEDRDLFNGHWPEGANLGADFSCGARWTIRF